MSSSTGKFTGPKTTVPTDPWTGLSVKGYCHCPLTLKSSVLPFRPNAILEITNVVKLIKENYRVMDNKAVSTTPSFQVMVGKMNAKGDAESFSLGTLKNLFGTIFTFERLLDRVHPASRLNHNDCLSLRRCSALAWNVTPALDQREGERIDNSLSSDQALGAIFNTRSIKQLTELMSHPLPYGHSAYTFNAHTKSISFNQSESSFKPETLSN